ncbi:MAG TPA: lamin tail domain-containing protein [Bacteroidia bacterium]|nr:lamin tail domain-containing protein [Bacteroidia bacterium]
MKKQLLTILSLGFIVFANAQCSELFFSEIDEGSGNNKTFEIYNPTNAPIALSNYRIIRFSNGSTVPTDSLTLSGTIAPHDVWVVANGQTTSTPTSPACDTALQNMADQLGGAYPDPCYQNGNDAIVLAKISPRTFVDIYGKIGEDPGQSWTDVFPYTDAAGAYWTKDHSLIRKSSVTQGVTVNPTAFNPTTEWDSLPKNNWSNLGMHNCSCPTGISEIKKSMVTLTVFPNPNDGHFTIDAGTKMESCEVYNTLGALVSSRVFTNGETKADLDLTGMPDGLYLVQVRLADGHRMTARVSVR